MAIPHVNTKSEAEAVVSASKFAPLGMRGSFTSRQGIGVDNYFSKANDATLTIILIEDIVAVNNLDEILEVDHIDVFYVAPGDLAQSMGMPGGAGSTEVTKVVGDSIKQIASSGKVAGTLVTEQTISRYVDMGASFFSFSWLPWLAQGAGQMQKEIDKARK